MVLWSLLTVLRTTSSTLSASASTAASLCMCQNGVRVYIKAFVCRIVPTDAKPKSRLRASASASHWRRTSSPRRAAQFHRRDHAALRTLHQPKAYLLITAVATAGAIVKGARCRLLEQGLDFELHAVRPEQPLLKQHLGADENGCAVIGQHVSSADVLGAMTTSLQSRAQASFATTASAAASLRRWPLWSFGGVSCP